MSDILSHEPPVNPIDQHTDEHEILRDKLKANGWHWLPGQGKGIFYDGWNKGEYDYEMAEYQALENPDWSNTGILCGIMIARDVDAKVPSTAAKLAKARFLAESPCGTRYGSKGSAKFYRASAPMRSITVRGIAPGDTKKTTIVEYIGMTRQLMCFGIHPDTNKPYHWEGNSPLDFAATDIPVSGSDDFLDQANDDKVIALDEGWTEVTITLQATDADKKQAREGNGGLVDKAMLEKMLSHIDPGQDHLACLPVFGALKYAEACELLVESDFSAEEISKNWARGDYRHDGLPANYLDGWAQKRWDSMDPFKKGGAKFGSLVHAAFAGGYKGPTRIDNPFDKFLAEDDVAPAPVKAHLMRTVAQSFYDIAELKAEIGITTPLVRNWLQEGFMNGILARRGGGKTTALVDLCCAGQADEKWFGVLSITHGYTFIYIALEDQTGVVQTCEAWQAAHPDIPINPRRFKIFNYPLNLLAKDRDLVLKEICDWIRAHMDHEKVCFVIDTFQRAATASQTDDEKMVEAVLHIEEYAKAFDRGLCVVAFQPPKSGTMTFLGAVQLENMCGVKIDLNYDETTGPDGVRELYVDRIKGAKRGSTLKFTIGEQQIAGTDDFGNPNTGPVVIYRGGHVDGQREAERREDNEILAQDVWSFMGGGEHSLDKVARECGGRDAGSYQWLPRSHKEGRRMQGHQTLRDRLREMAGHVWPLHGGLWELEVAIPPGTPLMAKGKGGPGKGVKVIIRQCPKVGPAK